MSTTSSDSSSNPPGHESNGPPPPPTEAIPLGIGPDGKKLEPKLGPDGQPINGPPLDKDGKPLPPPPIIGPDGKELPRPKDARGRPLPIYVTPEGKPVLDLEGNPVPLRFNDEGKPIPLHVEVPSASPSKASIQKTQIPDLIFLLGIFDLSISIIIAAALAYFLSRAYKKDPDGDSWKYLTGSFAICIIGVACSALPMVASKKNRANLLWFWLGEGVALLLLEIVLIAIAPEKGAGHIMSISYAAVRVIMSLCTNLYVGTEDKSAAIVAQGQAPQYNNQAMMSQYPKNDSGYYYERQELPQQQIVVQQPPTVIIQQQPVMVQPTYAYAYPAMGMGYGLGYGLGMGLGYGGYWGGYGGYHHHFDYCPYYDWGWGW